MRRVFVSGSVDFVFSPQLLFQLPEGLRSAPASTTVESSQLQLRAVHN
jgi:hypothetical protein